jgi:hypothetical protein
MSDCEKCGAPLTRKNWGNGGFVTIDSGGRIHDGGRCLIARAVKSRQQATAIIDLAQARLLDNRVTHVNVRHDLSEIIRCARAIWELGES